MAQPSVYVQILPDPEERQHVLALTSDSKFLFAPVASEREGFAVAAAKFPEHQKCASDDSLAAVDPALGFVAGTPDNYFLMLQAAAAGWLSGTRDVFDEFEQLYQATLMLAVDALGRAPLGRTHGAFRFELRHDDIAVRWFVSWQIAPLAEACLAIYPDEPSWRAAELRRSRLALPADLPPARDPVRIELGKKHLYVHAQAAGVHRPFLPVIRAAPGQRLSPEDLVALIAVISTLATAAGTGFPLETDTYSGVIDIRGDQVEHLVSITALPLPVAPAVGTFDLGRLAAPAEPTFVDTDGLGGVLMEDGMLERCRRAPPYGRALSLSKWSKLEDADRGLVAIAGAFAESELDNELDVAAHATFARIIAGVARLADLASRRRGGLARIERAGAEPMFALYLLHDGDYVTVFRDRGHLDRFIESTRSAPKANFVGPVRVLLVPPSPRVAPLFTGDLATAKLPHLLVRCGHTDVPPTRDDLALVPEALEAVAALIEHGEDRPVEVGTMRVVPLPLEG